MIDPIFLMETVVGLLVLSLLAQILSYRFRAPFIIFLLIEGIIVGPEVLNLLNPAVYFDVLSAIVAICVSVIVFDGGFQVDLKQLRGVNESVLRLSTIGVLITFLGITTLTYFSYRCPSPDCCPFRSPGYCNRPQCCRSNNQEYSCMSYSWQDLGTRECLERCC